MNRTRCRRTIVSVLIAIAVFVVIEEAVWFFFQHSMSAYWLRLREPLAVRQAIKYVEECGFNVGTHNPVNPLWYELCLSRPEWYCIKNDRKVETVSFAELHRTLCVIQPRTFSWIKDKTFDDEKLKIVRDLNKLEFLNINDTNVSDASAPMLAKLPKLWSINAKNTAMTIKAFFLFAEYAPPEKKVVLSLWHCDITEDEARRVEEIFRTTKLNVQIHGIVEPEIIPHRLENQ